MNMTAASKFRSIRDFPELVDYLGDELDWPIETDDFEEMTFEYSAAELGLDEKTAPKFLEIRRLRALDEDQPWGIFFIRFDDSKLPVVALRRLLNKLVLNKRSSSNSGNRASWHESDLLLISQTGNLGTKSISFAHFAANPDKTDLPILKVLGWDDDDTGLKIDYVIETLREKLVWPDDPTDSDAWRTQWRDAFTLKNREVIQSSKEMAKRLGHLALAIRTRLREVLAIESEEGPIHKLLSVLKEKLISDLDTDTFSDMYAQTIAYGLLSARIINPRANTADAAHSQIPIINPFLRDLMETFLNVGGRDHNSGVKLDFDELGVNEVVDLLDNTNMEAVLRDFGDRNQKEDPVMHFFEGFLEEYDSKIRKDRGVFYTPQPIVSFIVHSVDYQLRTEFGLKDGLADTTTWGELSKIISDLTIPAGTSPDQAFVQILDPATGTGTFPVEVIDLINKTMVAKWKAQKKTDSQINALWNEYVPNHLLPRLHGYELMMAPYAIAHMKVGLKLHETGYNFQSNERVRIYLTNALEPAHDTSGTFVFAIPALALEAEAVNTIKRNQRFTAVIGNPPYSGVSSNNGAWISKLVRDYYLVDGEPLGERNPKWLLDDYVKFIRLGQFLIAKSGAGALSYITNHSYIDNPTFRGLRRNFSKQFPSLSIIDLHGNTKKKEKAPNGLPDKNVFDIQQGVAIFIASNANNNSPSVQHDHLFGSRQEKYDRLNSFRIPSMRWKTVSCNKPYFLFTPTEMHEEFQSWFKIQDVMKTNGWGVATRKDYLLVDISQEDLKSRIDYVLCGTIDDAFKMGVRENKNWNFSKIKEKLGRSAGDRIVPYAYRPFDVRSVFYEPLMIERGDHRWPIARHLFGVSGNLSLLLSRTGAASGSLEWDVLFVADGLSDLNLFRRGGAFIFPLYLVNDESHLGFDKERTPNFSKQFLNSLSFNIKGNTANIENSAVLNPEDIFYYIYALLHSPSYRKRYSDFLKIDFPRIPTSINNELFLELCKLGKNLVGLHLLQVPLSDQSPGIPLKQGDCLVEKVSYSDQTIWIDKAKTQGFIKVPEKVWNFSIGGYQVCQKWLKDREPKGGKIPLPGRILEKRDIEHYQKVINAIDETIRIMAEVDDVINVHGGWPNAFIMTGS